MSADNWTVCPKCKRTAKSLTAENTRIAAESYGKVSAAEYQRLLAKSQEGVQLNSSLREDYEFYLSDEGHFVAVYHGRCQDCDFEFRFQHEEQINLNARAKA